jgi:hypothetical protein
VDEGKLSDIIAKKKKKTVSQGCILFPIIFLVVMDAVMNEIILGKKERNHILFHSMNPIWPDNATGCRTCQDTQSQKQLTM